MVSCGLRMKGLVVQRWRGISAECRILRGVVGVGSGLDGCAWGVGCRGLGCFDLGMEVSIGK